ncbi:hypothetical protein JTE90_015890 [Oedothorax gibbosus]|uniref:Uncharacterized protein n=1 Tax=Oedothorax gibbosus TaxID=931172 RepID=A0AAV6VUC0_9ARAC|nr:hypothetical protein JTE90_015890 [Oedothorax gibbosus]
MSVRRVRGSFRGSLRRYGSVESAKKPVRHFQWIYRKGEWRIAYGDICWPRHHRTFPFGVLRCRTLLR